MEWEKDFAWGLGVAFGNGRLRETERVGPNATPLQIIGYTQQASMREKRHTHIFARERKDRPDTL